MLPMKGSLPSSIVPDCSQPCPVVIVASSVILGVRGGKISAVFICCRPASDEKLYRPGGDIECVFAGRKAKGKTRQKKNKIENAVRATSSMHW